MTPQSGKQMIAINISPNISRRKDNQTMTFNMTGETYFIKNQKLKVLCYLQSEKI